MFYRLELGVYSFKHFHICTSVTLARILLLVCYLAFVFRHVTTTVLKLCCTYRAQKCMPTRVLYSGFEINGIRGLSLS